jgi:hypothetical protein
MSVSARGDLLCGFAPFRKLRACTIFNRWFSFFCHRLQFEPCRLRQANTRWSYPGRRTGRRLEPRRLGASTSDFSSVYKATFLFFLLRWKRGGCGTPCAPRGRTQRWQKSWGPIRARLRHWKHSGLEFLRCLAQRRPPVTWFSTRERVLTL